MSYCMAASCTSAATHGWQRWATANEVSGWAMDPSKTSVQPHESSAKVQVLACEQHKLSAELAILTHGADCAAPPTCDCQPRQLSDRDIGTIDGSHLEKTIVAYEAETRTTDTRDF